MAVPAIAQTRTKLRVLIVGCFQDQFERMKREFPDLEISGVINRKRNGQVDNRGTAVDADKILVMTKFVSHSALAQIDKSKATYCNGGWTEARRYLDTWSVYSRALKPAASLKSIQIETPPDAVVDYSAFRTCKPGDVLEFIRPENVPAHVFAQNVYEARRFYQANGGVESSQEIKGGKARVFIRDRVRPVLEMAEAALNAAPKELALAFEDQRMLETLWRDVYVMSLKLSPFASDAHHATIASVAADGWLEMFKTTGAKS